VRFAAYEMVVAPLALALALRLAGLTLGWKRASVEVSALVVYGYALEWTAIALFASHRYADGWQLAPLGVPLAVASVWAALILAALGLVGRLGLSTRLHRAAAAALLGIALDLLMEPVAVRTGLWEWTPAGPWLGVPIGNFVGWAVIIGAYAYGAERWGDAGGLPAQAARRAALGVGAIGALMLVGLVWRSLGAEKLFQGAAGWGVWAALLVATAGQRLWAGSPLEGKTLYARLGSGHTSLPGAVFVVVTSAFTWDALLLMEDALAIAAAGTCLSLLIASPDILPARIVERWRQSTYAAFAEGDGVIRVLMKPRNGQAWTTEDRTFLRAKVKALAHWTPALFLFLLPGSMLLLPAYAWLLDRRRRARPTIATPSVPSESAEREDPGPTPATRVTGARKGDPRGPSVPGTGS
jgi:uncharacterized membrane protein